MTETAADEQDLAKALDSVASAASSLDGTSTVQPDNSSVSSTDLPPIVPPNSPVAPVAPVMPASAAEPSFPPIIPAHDSSDRPNDQFTMPTPPPVADPMVAPTDMSAPVVDTTSSTDSSVSSDTSSSTPLDPTAVVADGPLADIKKDALDELRPLVDKLDVSAEEKFDTYLLLIRSTDDTNLVGPAHEAAKAITDEAKRAEALLEIIKEIDYLSRKK